MFQRESCLRRHQFSQPARSLLAPAGWLKHVRGQVNATGLESFGEVGPDACGGKRSNDPASGGNPPHLEHKQILHPNHITFIAGNLGDMSETACSVAEACNLKN